MINEGQPNICHPLTPVRKLQRIAYNPRQCSNNMADRSQSNPPSVYLYAPNHRAGIYIINPAVTKDRRKHSMASYLLPQALLKTLQTFQNLLILIARLLTRAR